MHAYIYTYRYRVAQEFANDIKTGLGAIIESPWGPTDDTNEKESDAAGQIDDLETLDEMKDLKYQAAKLGFKLEA